MSSNSGLRRPVFVFLFLSVIGDVSGVITSPPLNTVTEVGQQAIFNCTSSITLQHWALTTKREDVGTAAAADIAISCIVQPGFATHYEVDRPGGNSNVCNLIVKDVTMQQAGIYTCSDTGTGPSAILTVIDSSPMIIYNNTSDFMEGENVIITCTLNYNGSVEPASTLRPHFYWTDHTGKNVSSFYNSTPVNGPAISQIEHTAGRQDITPFTCHVYLQLISSATPGYVTNVPSVNSSASSPPITVLYIPSTPVITSRPEVITIQGVSCGISVLTCSNSTGNPAPNYRWYDSAENVILTTTNTLTLAEVNRNYKCEVYNTIRNVEYNESVTYPVSDGNCASTAQCCVFPHDETTSVTVKGCDNGTVCDCSQGSSGIILTCKADTFPNPSYMWTGPGVDVIFSSVLDKVQMNGTHHCVAYFNESLTNYTGDAKFPNGTNETTVDSCSNPVSSTTHIVTILTTPTTPACNHTACPVESPSDFPVGAVVGAVIGVIVIANVVATCLFFWYYKRVEVSHSGKRERNNKLRLDRRFTWLKKMMPCVSDTKESAGSNCLWVSLFILLGTLTGIVTFPIWIILANKYEKNNETSALNRRENGEGNGSGGNGRRPANISSANHSQPPPANQMNAIRREDPYQNESRENIELNNSLRSRNLLLSDSKSSKPPPAGRPPPPPNKPTINMSAGRSKDYTVNDETPANPEHTTYADLPFVPRNTLPTATPVQFLNVSNDTYAALNKT